LLTAKFLLCIKIEELGLRGVANAKWEILSSKLNAFVSDKRYLADLAGSQLSNNFYGNSLRDIVDIVNVSN